MPRVEDWEEISNEFLKPFPNSEIGFLPRAGRQFAHIDARAVMRRLDQVVGPEGWLWDFEVIPSNSGACVKGTLTVVGIPKSDVGEDSGNEEPMKRACSDALKRAAIHFGIGRFLYELGTINTPQIPPEKLADAAVAAGWVGDRELLIHELRQDRQPQRGPVHDVRRPEPYAPAYGDHGESREDAGEANQPRAFTCQWDGCGKQLTEQQRNVSRKAFGKELCPVHQKEQAQGSPAPKPARPAPREEAPAAAGNGGDLRCADCGAEIDQKVYNYSTSRFGRALCFADQDKARPKSRNAGRPV